MARGPDMNDVAKRQGTDAVRAAVEAARVPDGLPGLAARTGISARALMLKEFDPIRWVVPGYIVEGMTVLAGAPKLGKSWMMLGAAVAVGCGGTAFGAVPCVAGDVLYLALEDNERRLKDRLKQMRLNAWPERVTFCTQWPNLDDGCCREIEAWARTVPDPRMVVVDVFARVRGINGGRESAYDADYRFGSQLQTVASGLRLGLVATHHTRKAGADDDPFDAVSGTRGLTGAADSVLVMRRPTGGQHPILYGRGRDMPEVETAMEFEPTTGAWYIVGDAADIAKTEERQELLEVLGRSPDPMTPTEIAEAIGKKRSNVAHLLARLVTEGKVWKAPKGRYTPVTPFTHSLNSERSEQSERDTTAKPTAPQAPAPRNGGAE